MPRKILTYFFAIMLTVTALLPARTATAESLVGSNVDSRVLIGLKVPAEAVQSLMPDGWTAIAFPGGPLKDANFLMVFIDGLLQRNADGEPLTPPTRRALAMGSLGKQGDAVRLFVMRIYTTTPEADPYEVNVAANITRQTVVEGPANEGRSKTDTWVVETGGADKLSFSLEYTTGIRNWAPAEAFPYSATNPEFSRIYRVNQLTELVASKALGKSASGTFNLTSDLADLSAVLDGSEEIMAVIDVPMYVRQIFLP